MEARVADMMELQEAAKSRRRGVVEKAKSVNQGEGSSASRREKRTADDMEEARGSWAADSSCEPVLRSLVLLGRDILCKAQSLSVHLSTQLAPSAGNKNAQEETRRRDQGSRRASSGSVRSALDTVISQGLRCEEL